MRSAEPRASGEQPGVLYVVGRNGENDEYEELARGPLGPAFKRKRTELERKHPDRDVCVVDGDGRQQVLKRVNRDGRTRDEAEPDVDVLRGEPNGLITLDVQFADPGSATWVGRKAGRKARKKTRKKSGAGSSATQQANDDKLGEEGAKASTASATADDGPASSAGMESQDGGGGADAAAFKVADVGPEYMAREDGIYWRRRMGDHVREQRLTSFTARITADITWTDGVRSERSYELEVNGSPERITVPAREFEKMGWVGEHLPPLAAIEPDASPRRVAAAIRAVSNDIDSRTIYGHLGWVETSTGSAYVHAGGAVGDHAGEVEAAPPQELSRFQLLDPIDPQDPTELTESIRESLALLDAGKDRVTVPALASVYRAVMGNCDFAMHLSGPSGVYKTGFAALLQQHFGPGLDAAHLPGAWSSTANALEALAFQAKDSLLVVDDYVPQDPEGPRKAERLLRSQGNQSGRARLSPAATHAVAMPPRALIFSTGESVPGGASLRGRTVNLEVAPGDIDYGRISAARALARQGRFAQALGGFVRSLAKNQFDGSLEDRAIATQAGFEVAGQHPRDARNVAQLAIGMRRFLRFAMDCYAITPAEHDRYRERLDAALRVVAAEQAQQQEDTDEAEIFLSALRSALASGRAHLADRGGGVPSDPRACGWARTESGSRPRGAMIGWVKEGEAYLLPDLAYRAAKPLAGSALLPPRTLWKRLDDKGALASAYRRRGRVTRISVDGGRYEVLHLDSSAIWPDDGADAQDADGGDDVEEGGDGPDDGPLTKPTALQSKPVQRATVRLGA